MTAPPELPDRAALLLDLDGTLLDIAPTPDAVIVPPSLPPTPLALRARLDNAVAVVTGRPLEQIDALLPGVPFAVAGEHGAAIRPSPAGEILREMLPEVPAEWLVRAERIVAAHHGALLERKDSSFVLHYRLAPQAGASLRAALDAMVGDDGAFVVMPAHMAWEVKPHGADKGRAVASLMTRAPFAGRVPVYVGDDVTDEDGMREARARGGLGLRVQDVFGDAAGVRDWLATLARVP